MSKRIIPSSWQEANLESVTQLVGGGTPSRKNPELFTGDIVWLTPSQIPKNRITIIIQVRSSNPERSTDRIAVR